MKDSTPPISNVREATVSDAAALARLTTALGYKTSEEQMRSRLRAIFASDQYATLVAMAGEDIVGFLGLMFGLYYEYDGSYARIVALSIAKDAQRRGVGKKLVAAAEEMAKARGAITCIVNSGVQRIEAHQFYEALGFSWKSKAFCKQLYRVE